MNLHPPFGGMVLHLPRRCLAKALILKSCRGVRNADCLYDT